MLAEPQVAPSHLTDRRLKILWLSPSVLIGLRLFGGHRIGDRVEWVTLDLPPDTEVLAVHYSPERDAFGFRLRHPSWDEVLDGNPIPDAHVTCRLESLPVKTTALDHLWMEGPADSQMAFVDATFTTDAGRVCEESIRGRVVVEDLPIHRQCRACGGAVKAGQPHDCPAIPHVVGG